MAKICSLRIQNWLLECHEQDNLRRIHVHSCIRREKLLYSFHYKPRLVYFFPISKDHFFVFKEVFSENSVLMYGLYSRAASNQAAYDGARTVIKKKQAISIKQAT